MTSVLTSVCLCSGPSAQRAWCPRLGTRGADQVSCPPAGEGAAAGTPCLPGAWRGPLLREGLCCDSDACVVVSPQCRPPAHCVLATSPWLAARFRLSGRRSDPSGFCVACSRPRCRGRVSRRARGTLSSCWNFTDASAVALGVAGGSRDPQLSRHLLCLPGSPRFEPAWSHPSLWSVCLRSLCLDWLRAVTFMPVRGPSGHLSAAPCPRCGFGRG